MTLSGRGKCTSRTNGTSNKFLYSVILCLQYSIHHLNEETCKDNVKKLDKFAPDCDKIFFLELTYFWGNF